MNVNELRALEPKLELYELKPDGRYLICIDKNLSVSAREHITKSLHHVMADKGIALVGVLDFVPRIFELDPMDEV